MELEDVPEGTGTLLLFPGALGDAICFEPTVRHFARLGPVTYCARGGALEVGTLFPTRPSRMSLDSPEVARLFAPITRETPVHADWLVPFARIVSFTGSSSAEMAARLEATGRGVLIPFPRREGRVHASREFLCLAGCHVSEGAADPRLDAPQADTAALEGLRRPVLAVHPGSGGAEKRAARSLLDAVTERWREQGGGSVLVLLGPAEEAEHEEWRRVAERVERPATIEALAAALIRADAYLGNDSGPSHVAAALGCHAVVLFTATDPRRFGPLGPQVKHVALGQSDTRSALERVWRALGATLP